MDDPRASGADDGGAAVQADMAQQADDGGWASLPTADDGTGGAALGGEDAPGVSGAADGVGGAAWASEDLTGSWRYWGNQWKQGEEDLTGSWRYWRPGASWKGRMSHRVYMHAFRVHLTSSVFSL